jgi:hypothetical protein
LFASIDGSGASPSIWLALAANLVALLLMAPLALYAFPLLVMRDSAPLSALRDAVILASRHVVNTIGLLAMGLLFGLAIVYLSVALWLLLPAVWGIFIVNNCRLVAGEELARA